jgi:uncharacterized membrane protein YoaK (UPF0700 family)
MPNLRGETAVLIASAATGPAAGAPDPLLANRLGLGLPLLLGTIAGSTDTICFLALNGLFTAHITGNLIVLAARVIAGDPTIISTILSVPVFMLMLLLTSLMARFIERAGSSSLRPLLLVQLLLLLGCLLLSVATGPWSDADAPLAVGASMFAVAAMSVQNALVQLALKNTPTTAVMTTNVTHLMVDLGAILLGSDRVEIAKAKSRALQVLPVIVGFVLGCGLGAASEATAGLWALIVPTALASFAAARQWLRDTDGQA